MENSISPPGRVYGVAAGSIQFDGVTRPFYYSNTRLGRLIAEQVLTGASYPELHVPGEIRTIIDVGANVGASTLYFARLYPQARVLAFEPFAESYDLLVRNVQGLSGISTFNLGLFDRDQQAALHLGLQDSVTNSVGIGHDTSRDQQVLITLRDAGKVLAEQGVTQIDILKLDTEGCELPILRSLSTLVARAGVIYIEFHHEADRREIDRMLSPTHVLALGQITSPHRGELTYLLRELVPPEVTAMGIEV